MTDDEIIEMYKNETPMDEIIKYSGMTEHEIRSILKDNQVDRKYNTFSDELYNRLEYLYDVGKTTEQVGYDLCINKVSITKILRKRNHRVRTYSENNRRYNRNSNYFDKIDTVNKAYILGLLWADGCNLPLRSQIVLSLQERDKAVLDSIKNQLEYQGNLSFIKLHAKNQNYQNQYRLCIEDIHMSKVLESYGMVRAKSLILKFPSENVLPKELHPSFIRGYFDGDGSVGLQTRLRKTQATIVGTWDVCQKISVYLKSSGCKNSIQHPKQSLDHNTYVVSINGFSNVRLFGNIIYSQDGIKMQRKYDRFVQIKNFKIKTDS